MPRLLIIAHKPSANTRALGDAVIRGAQHEDLAAIELRALSAFEAGPEDVRRADGIILGSTENFGYMSGAMKDFFERIYYPCLGKTQGLPYAIYIKAGLDGQGALSSMERIITGLRWKKVQAPLICKGEFKPAFLAQGEEFGMTMAAGLEAGIF